MNILRKKGIFACVSCKHYYRDCCKELLTKLNSGHCLPTFTDEGLKIECTLTPKIASFRSLAKAWEDASRCIVDTYIAENVIERQFKSSAEVWKELLAFCESGIVSIYVTTFKGVFRQIWVNCKILSD